MLVAGFPAGAWGTNCYVVAPGPGEQCVVIDPGHEALPDLDAILTEHRLQPVAVLLTHGHIDHVFSVVPVCGGRDIPAYIHPDDRHMLSDPGIALGLSANQQLFGGLELREPDDLRLLADGSVVDLAGLPFTVAHAPGHTKGSVTFRLSQPGEGDVVLFSGDVLFAGSIGRTDLPGGDFDEMLASLARVILPLPDELPVLSGHGPATTIGDERATNPYLAQAARAAGALGAAAAGDVDLPARGTGL